MKIQLITLLLSFVCCNGKLKQVENNPVTQGIETRAASFDTLTKTIHVLVALCDNTYQGIVPVPTLIGNGQDPFNNLYWGCAYGIKTFFKKSAEWNLIQTEKIDSILLERLVFKHISKNVYLVADAYNGKYIKTCTRDFLLSCSGQKKATMLVNKTRIGIHGNASLITYIGHDGLMDFKLTEEFENTDGKIRDCIILACISKNYYSPLIKSTKANPLIWTTGLMCPEAYTLHDALRGYVNSESNEAIRCRAVRAYSSYQKCSEKSARGLLVTGW